LIGSNDGRFFLGAIREDDRRLRHARDHMVVGQNIPLVRDEQAAAADRLAGSGSEIRRLAGDGTHHSHDRRTGFLHRLGNSGFKIRGVDDQGLLWLDEAEITEAVVRDDDAWLPVCCCCMT